MKKPIALLLLLMPCLAAMAQTKPDSVKRADTLKTVQVKSSVFYQPLISTPNASSIIGPRQLKQQNGNSFVPALNTVPGVRMEERSPGSYRLSLRGSLLRSPFGVRNVKVYFDELPLTDAGGNTYLNAIDVNSIASVQVLRGPDGSMYGANSGGVVLIEPTLSQTTTYSTIGIKGGSYGLFQENAGANINSGGNQLTLNQAHQTYDGYRIHSNMRRNYVQAVDKWQYGPGNELKALGFYSDLFYNTPGGLTLAQMQADPTAARPATKTVPGALEQNISITTQMAMGGLVNYWHILPRLQNITAVSWSHVYFANPFITNFEQRNENTLSARSYFQWDGFRNNQYWKFTAGLEWQQTNSNINNYGNKAGVKDTVQKLDKINGNQHFFFARYTGNFGLLNFEAGLSYNMYGYNFKNLYPLNQSGFTPVDLNAQWMPRLALSCRFNNAVAWRGVISRGYSNPTTAEVRPTDNVINTGLQAQTGWNYETGFRLRSGERRMTLDAAVFYYRTDNAIVRRLHANETEYYINAGGTNQTGAEVTFNWVLLRDKLQGFIRDLEFNTAYTYSHYQFRNYTDATTSYSGNWLTGVPRNVLVSNVQIVMPSKFSLFIQHNYTSRLPLNDANTVYADKYHLLQAKLSWQHTLSRKTVLEVFAGGDNLLNQKYSLGNDLNAVGNRYFNPSPLRNYYGGANVLFK